MSPKTYAALLGFLMIAVMIYPVTGQEEYEGLEWNRRIPFLGAQPTIVLLVQFTDVKLTISKAQAEQLVKTLDDFIRKASYGRTWLEYTIHPKVITLPKPMSYYGAPPPGAQYGDDWNKIMQFHLTVIELAKRDGIDFTRYKHVITIHAGKDENVAGSANDIWAHCFNSKDIYLLVDKYGLEAAEKIYRKSDWGVMWDALVHKDSAGKAHILAGILTVAEVTNTGMMNHEFTHSMWVFDQYVYGKDGYQSASETGVWTNMDYGPFFDPPVDIDGWSKYLLGWVEAVTVEKDGEYTIHTLDKSDEPHGLIIPINDKEYYFIHARRPVKSDAALPGPGVLVMKVNKFKYSNVEGEPFMAQLFDANPDTPRECEEAFGDWHYRQIGLSLCAKFDAPFYSSEGYRGKWTARFFDGHTEGPLSIDLLKAEYVTEEGFRISVLSFDERAGVARIRVSLGGQGQDGGATVVTVTRTVTGTATQTLYTTVSTVGTVTRTVVVTVTTTQAIQPTIQPYLSIVIILAGLLFTVALIAVRRRPRMPPPPPPPPTWTYATDHI